MDTKNGTIIDGRYEFMSTLGKGKFAIVKRARHLLTGEDVAIKVIDKDKIDEISRLHIHKEVTCMKLLRHPHVIKLYEAIDTEKHLYLIMELGDGGDLYDYIMKHESGLEECRAKVFFAQMVSALAYCHRHYVVHRDLKPENMVICSEHLSVKLTDFGFSNVFEKNKTLQTSCGSLAYSAPEILLGEEYDASAVDVWSMGVILYKLVSGEAPFAHANDSETLTMIMDCKYEPIDKVSAECNDLIDRILRREPADRIKINDIMRHPWLAGVSADIYEPKTAKHRSFAKLPAAREHDKICSHIKQLASLDEINEALKAQKFNFLTAAYFLFAEKLYKARNNRRSTRSTPRSTHISPIPSLPPSPRSTSPTPGTSPPRSSRHSSGKISPGPPFPREHLTITPRKGPVTREGIEHLAEEERSSRSQGATDSEDEYDGVQQQQLQQPSPDEILTRVDAKLRERIGSEGGGDGDTTTTTTGNHTNTTTTGSSTTGNTSANAATPTTNAKSSSRSGEKRDRSNNGGRGSRTELKEIDEEPESEDDDFDIEASPRQIAKNRLKMGGSPTSTRRRRNRPDIRDDCISPSNSDSIFLLSASSDSETSESRRSSSRDLSTYVNQLKYKERRDSSEDRDQNGPSNGTSSNQSGGGGGTRGRQNQPQRSNKVNNGRHVQAPAGETTKYADQSIDNIPEVIVTPPNDITTTNTTSQGTKGRRRKKKKKDFESISDKSSTPPPQTTSTTLLPNNATSKSGEKYMLQQKKKKTKSCCKVS